MIVFGVVFMLVASGVADVLREWRLLRQDEREAAEDERRREQAKKASIGYR